VSQRPLHINLPTGQTATNTSVGQIHLKNGLILKDTLCVLSFKYNFLSSSKLIRDNRCSVTFYSYLRVIYDYVSKTAKGIGGESKGLYFLVDTDMDKFEVKEHLQTAGECKYSMNCGISWHKSCNNAPKGNIAL